MAALRAALAVLVVMILPVPALGDSGERLIARTAYFEARSDGMPGMLAVAFVVRNRLLDGRWGNTVQRVVHSPSQFSVWSRGGAARRGKAPDDDPNWRLALQAARLALSGAVKDPSRGATFYHERSINPAWSHGMRRVAVVGHHIFLSP